jgi:hypothetical protein
MEGIDEIASRLERAERRVRWLTTGMVSIAVLSAGLLVGCETVGGDERGDVVTARGLVIVDAEGRQRLVLGAPLASASEDARLAGTTGITVLDSAGRLVTSLGMNNPLIHPDGSAGERRGTSYGMTFYDPRTGQERGGIGAFDDGRANVCLDWAGVEREAACMSVWADDQYAAVILNGTPAEETIFDRVVLYVGSDGTGRIKAFGGGRHQDGVSIDVGRGVPEVTVFDSTQTAAMDLVEVAAGRRR